MERLVRGRLNAVGFRVKAQDSMSCSGRGCAHQRGSRQSGGKGLPWKQEQPNNGAAIKQYWFKSNKREILKENDILLFVLHCPPSEYLANRNESSHPVCPGKVCSYSPGYWQKTKNNEITKEPHNAKMILVHQNFNQSWTSSPVTCPISHSKFRADMGSRASCPAPVSEFLHHKSAFSLPTIQSHEVTTRQFEWKHSSYHWDSVRSQG